MAGVTVGGHRLHTEHHAPKGAAKGALVLVHGLNSNLTEFGALPERLAAQGYHALAFDQRGFGQSEGQVGLTNAELAVADIAAATDFLEQQAPGLPVGILGHSLGGAYAIRALARLHRHAFGILAHPVDRLWDELSAVKRGAYHVLGRWSERRVRRGKPPGSVRYSVHYSEIFVSKEAARAAQRPAFLLKRASLANYRMASGMRASDLAPYVDVPTLTVWSLKDRAVRPEHTLRLAARLGHPTRFLEHDGGHSCFRDLDGEKVAAGIVAFLDATVPGLAPRPVQPPVPPAQEPSGAYA